MGDDTDIGDPVRGKIWNDVMTHVNRQNDTISLDDVGDYDENEVRDVLAYMVDADWLREPHNGEWPVGAKGRDLQNSDIAKRD